MRPLGVIGPLSRDVVAGAPARIGGGPWHAARALHALRTEALVVGKCGAAEAPAYRRSLAALGLPASVEVGGETTSFSFSYAAAGTRTMRVETIGEPWREEELPETLLRRVEWLHVAPLLRGDVDAALLGRLARGRRVLLDAQGLVRVRRVGPLELDADFDPAILRHVTALKLAEEEAAVVDLERLDVPEVLVTAGAAGARVITRDGVEHVAAHAVDADPTGAGDAFAVTYLASRAEGHAPLSAARRATALVASLLARRAT
jgi:sugar/nucleoside kinase (ribokinase family)